MEAPNVQQGTNGNVERAFGVPGPGRATLQEAKEPGFHPNPGLARPAVQARDVAIVAVMAQLQVETDDLGQRFLGYETRLIVSLGNTAFLPFPRQRRWTSDIADHETLEQAAHGLYGRPMQARLGNPGTPIVVTVWPHWRNTHR
jgi:hypothetical protein